MEPDDDGLFADDESLDDARDLIELERAREAEGGEPTISLDEVAKKFGVTLER